MKSERRERGGAVAARRTVGKPRAAAGDGWRRTAERRKLTARLSAETVMNKSVEDLSNALERDAKATQRRHKAPKGYSGTPNKKPSDLFGLFPLRRLQNSPKGSQGSREAYQCPVT